MEQAARLARAQAEQRLQEVRGRLETVRLQADRVLPADAARRASEMAARAEAAHIATDGEALATVLREMEATWAKAGTDAKDIFVLQQVEGLVHIVAERVSALEVASVRLVDGGDGSALAALHAGDGLGPARGARAHHRNRRARRARRSQGGVT
jgi:flotillin